VPPNFSVGEAVANYLAAVGIKTQVRVMERAAFFTAWREKKLKGLILGVAATQGNAATVLEALAVSGGYYASGGYADIDALFQQQATERDPQRRLHERVMFAPTYEVASLHTVGPRVAEVAIGITPLFYFPVPYEEIRL
jgi:peptide/nickel transport system substrate-binding protein